MTIREVAEYLKLTEKTAYRYAADGKIPGFKVGGLAVPALRDRKVDRAAVRRAEEAWRRLAPGPHADVRSLGGLNSSAWYGMRTTIECYASPRVRL